MAPDLSLSKSLKNSAILILCLTTAFLILAMVSSTLLGFVLTVSLPVWQTVVFGYKFQLWLKSLLAPKN